jgi:Rps23 Pro-64 3,4-dihydroxylase Tpa1-like proline 4-hydroxylase
MPTRAEFAAAIEERLRREAERLSREFATSTPTRHFVVDELLPPEWLRAVAQAFPPAPSLLLKKSLRERKRVGVAIDRYDPIVGDILYAFQAPGVVAAVAAATGIQGLHADATLYASGISVMGRGDFLDPHIDNSHDGDQRRYRVLNLLLYATSGWNAAYGGNLELWRARRDVPHTVPSLFNRLVVMETGPRSWHSVSRVNVEGSRLCVSNYYFADHPSAGGVYRHVTTFAGRPEAPLKRMVLAIDAVARNAIGRAFPSLLRKGRHRRIEADS